MSIDKCSQWINQIVITGALLTLLSGVLLLRAKPEINDAYITDVVLLSLFALLLIAVIFELFKFLYLLRSFDLKFKIKDLEYFGQTWVGKNSKSGLRTLSIMKKLNAVLFVCIITFSLTIVTLNALSPDLLDNLLNY